MRKLMHALRALFQKPRVTSDSDHLALDFLQGHLDRTSRSFAFCIKELNPAFRQVVSLNYLLCRILDTIEDYPMESFDQKNRQFEIFESFILKQPLQEDVENWIEAFPSGIPSEYKMLVNDSFRLFSGLHQNLEPQAMLVSQNCILKMKQGMKIYSTKWSSNQMRLADLGEVNRYCYFVAGIVGELLRKLYCQIYKIQDVDLAFKLDSIHFGLYLQKINFLKDKLTDEAEGRYFIPDRLILLGSLKENAIGAFNFLKKIPIKEKGFRLFCAWSLFIGLAYLELIGNNQYTKKSPELSRTQTLFLIQKIRDIIDHNEDLESLFNSYFEDLKKLSTDNLQTSQTPTWFTNAIAELLSPYEITELRL